MKGKHYYYLESVRELVSILPFTRTEQLLLQNFLTPLPQLQDMPFSIMKTIPFGPSIPSGL